MSEVRTLAIDFTKVSRRRRHQRAIIVAAIGVTLLASSGYWLGNSGILGTKIQPLPGGAASGNVATISSSTLIGSVTRNGVLTYGVPVSRIIVAKSYADASTGQTIKINLAWTNASTATLNGNDIVALGLFYPVSTSTGTCHLGTLFVSDSSTVPTLGTGGGVCVAPDTAATGGYNVDTSAGSAQQGMAILSHTDISGYLKPGTTPPSTLAICAADTSTSATWCQPPGVGDQSGSTNVAMYVLAQVVNNGGNVPPGSQPAPGAFTFLTSVKAIA